MVAASFINTSFEVVDGVAPTLSSAAEPFVLADEEALVVLRNTVAQTVVFEVGTRAIASTGSAPFAFANAQTIDVTVDGTLTTVTLNSADFVDITNATAPELGAQLATVSGADTTVSGDVVTMTSQTKGSTSTLAFGGTAFAASGFPAADAGVDYFADITNATAAEVVAQLDLQLTDITSVDNAGVVEMTNDDVGDDACLQILEGFAQDALDFSTGEDCGVSRAGHATGWTVAFVSTGIETIEWHTNPGTLEFPSGMERFDLGWASNHESEFDFSAFELDPMPVAGLAGPVPYEDFMWSVLLLTLPATSAASFDSLLVAEPVEDFDDGWDGNESFSTTLPPGVATQFTISLGSVGYESFDDSWKDNHLPSTAGSSPIAWGTSALDAETFESTTNVSLEFEILAAAVGDAYTVTFNGTSLTYLSGVAVTGTVATDVAQMISDASIPFGAFSVGNYVRVFQDQPGEETSYSVTSVPGGRITVIDGIGVNKADDWTGFAYNPVI